MLYATNRFPKQSIRTRAGRRFEFDPDNNAPSNSVFFCERKPDGESIEIGSSGWLSRLKESRYRQLLVYIHGFSNLPESVFEATKELQALCDAKREGEALVVPMIWPCDNDLGIVQDYWDDQKSADASAFSFARALGKFMAWRNDEKRNPPNDPCLKRINVLAHSMGARALRETLAAWSRYDLADGVPLLFRNVFLVAADIVNDSLERGRRGELICHAARNVVVYHASDDLALRASKAANLRNKVASRRLGHTGPESMERAFSNVYSVDCDNINHAYDPPAGHSYFRYGDTPGAPGLVFDHLFSAMETGRIRPNDPHRKCSIL